MTVLQTTVGAHTDAGRRRAVNEDAFLAAMPVFVVADGMGGHDAGDRASAAVVEIFRSLLHRDAVTVEEKYVPFFKTGKLLRDRLNAE